MKNPYENNHNHGYLITSGKYCESLILAIKKKRRIKECGFFVSNFVSTYKVIVRLLHAGCIPASFICTIPSTASEARQIAARSKLRCCMNQTQWG
jgi:hypothetical protein